MNLEAMAEQAGSSIRVCEGRGPEYIVEKIYELAQIAVYQGLALDVILRKIHKEHMEHMES